jgi:PAS domain S-box-containing protein
VPARARRSIRICPTPRTGDRGTACALRQVTDNSFRLARREPLNPPVGGNDEISHLDRVFHEVADALNEAWRKERAVLENAQDVICSIDEEGRFTKVSHAALQVWGFPADELIGRPFTDIILSEDIDQAIDATHAIMMEQTDDLFETRIMRRDGRIVHILWSAHWSSGERSMFCVAHDITERKAAEQEIRASESRVRSIVESMPVGLLILDKKVTWKSSTRMES